jgi:hypothetical protein
MCRSNLCLECKCTNMKRDNDARISSFQEMSLMECAITFPFRELTIAQSYFVECMEGLPF